MLGIIKDAIRSALAYVFNSTTAQSEADQPTGKRRAAVYARSATCAARESSIARQTTASIEYARRNGLDVVAVHVDDGMSGLVTDRPGLEHVLDDVTSGRISVVIVEDVARISRSAATLFDVYERLTAAGVQLHVHGDGAVDHRGMAVATGLHGR